MFFITPLIRAHLRRHSFRFFSLSQSNPVLWPTSCVLLEEGESWEKRYDVRQRGYRQSVIILPSTTPHLLLLSSSSFFSNPLFPSPGTGPALARSAVRRNPKANTGRLNRFAAARLVYAVRAGAVNSSCLPPEKYKRRHAAYVKDRRLVVCLVKKAGGCVKPKKKKRRNKSPRTTAWSSTAIRTASPRMQQSIMSL